VGYATFSCCCVVFDVAFRYTFRGIVLYVRKQVALVTLFEEKFAIACSCPKQFISVHDLCMCLVFNRKGDHKLMVFENRLLVSINTRILRF
jgi:hypothetical protein